MNECLFALKVTVGTSTLITLYLFFCFTCLKKFSLGLSASVPLLLWDWQITVGVHLSGTARRWYHSTPASSLSVTVSRPSPATHLGAWSQWRRSRSLRSVHSLFHFILSMMEHLMQFKHKFIMRMAPKLSSQSHFFHPHFLACVVLWFHCQQSPHWCSSPTCAHYRMFTVFYEHEQETYMVAKQKHMFALFSCFFCASFKQWCLDV